MAGKRSATSDLNHENWDKEEPPEDAGTFQRASEDSLKSRVIKTARRRNPISSVRDGGDGEKKSAFTSFTGFGKAAPTTSTAFSFLSNLTKPNTPPKVNGTGGNSEKPQNDASTFKYSSSPITGSGKLNEKVTTNVFGASTANNSNKNNNPTNSSPEKSNEYYSKLKGLNESVSKWIKSHVDANPLINLQPIFRDYEKYFAELEKEKDLKPPDTNNKTDSSSMSSFAFKPTTNVPDSTTEKFQSISKNESSNTSEKNIPKFTFGTSSTSSATPTFSFGSKASADSGNKSFSFVSTNKEASKTTPTVPSFSFGAKPSISAAMTTSETAKSISTTTPTFSFGAQQASKEIPSFSFGSKTSPVSSPVGAGASTTVPPVSLGTASSAKEATKPIPSFSFGTGMSSSTSAGTTANDTTKTTTTIPSFSFGKSITPFSSASPFTFANAVKPVSTDNKEKDAEEEEEPPTNEFTPVVEKDHVYTTRCKVFVKKEDKFGDRGVGNLYLKPIPDSEKVQMIVRADTNLGNLLLNCILSESIPTKRLGTKDVMLVCVPTPESEPPPVPVLLRVKSSEEADKLLETLNKYKK
ncbi:unnamed protein product [Diabrotica balteata]|uniref:RanBD1 domain-containing protein n=1 Tax=Diabrotica balteata TaxID=107213 RepID=A0A9N9X973_DIABA|nr:unnamed protein product [Diabrotica balteata]